MEQTNFESTSRLLKAIGMPFFNIVDDILASERLVLIFCARSGNSGGTKTF
jgi:hypothetical protein